MEQNSNLNGKAIASFIVSCVALLSGCCVWYIAVVCGVVAIVLGILALREGNRRQKDLAIAGIVVGATGLAIGIVAAVLCCFPRRGMDLIRRRIVPIRCLWRCVG